MTGLCIVALNGPAVLTSRTEAVSGESRSFSSGAAQNTVGSLRKSPFSFLMLRNATRGHKREPSSIGLNSFLLLTNGGLLIKKIDFRKPGVHSAHL